MEKQKRKYNKNYQFKIGDVVNGLTITEQCYKQEKDGRLIKAYKYKCTVCGYDCGEYYKKGVYYNEHVITESNLKLGAGCAACSKNGLVIPTINSIHALRPEIEKFLKNKDDALKYAPRSNQKLECICPNCGREYIRSCSKIADYGVPCICEDGFSYPEKFIFNVLTQLNLEFKPQWSFVDSMLRYDFYIQQYNIIVEANGIQHYKKKWDYRDEVKNDILKREFAFSHGFTDDTYIILDCRESSLDFIKSSLFNSKLSEYFDLNKIDFIECSRFASSNLAKIASELWREGNAVKDIADKMKLHKHTIISYLKQGNENEWCNYAPGSGMRRYNQQRSVK